MKKLIILAALLAATAAEGQRSSSHKVTYYKLDTAEKQLQYKKNHDIGLGRFHAERDLEKLRQQKQAMRNARYQPRSSSYSPPAPATRTTYKTYTPPKPDWKEKEHPEVLTKGIAKLGDRTGVLVNQGQIVFPGDVFATTYQGQTMHWRVLDISGEDANFERVNPDGTPFYTEPEEPEKLTFWQKLIGRK